MITTSIFDLFKVGPGPSSSHTIGLMKATFDFLERATKAAEKSQAKPFAIYVHLYGSLSLTGKGHGTDRAVIAGLLGWLPENVNGYLTARWQKPIRTDYEYNFAGEITKEKKTYKVDGETDRTKIKSYTYDHVGRKTACDLNIGNINERLVNYEFDEIGRLNRKVFLPNGNFTYGGAKDYILRPDTDGIITQSNTQDIARKAVILEPVNEVDAVNLTSYSAEIDPNAPTGIPITGLQKINYKYHIRGGLSGINLDGSGNPALATPEADLFAYKLDYETAGFYDGNIGKETWKSAKNTGTNRSYDYTYDPAKRLKSANYSGGMFANESYAIENISYDKNGNINTFWRKGMTGANGNSFGYVDQMQYFYSGNTLNGITDAVNGNLDVQDFRDNGSSSDYTYHPDGSLKSDGNRNISLIEWDTFLKKPKQITYVNGDWIKHFYDGSGRRFKTTDSEGTVWEYIDDVVYKNGEFYQISDDEGRILFENDNYTYEFNYKDHLGNVRVSFKAVGNQLTETQENSYYPFGLSHAGTDFTLGANENNFQYNGKEKINSFGLNYSDYGFRTYDFLTNRFISVDPISEKFPELTIYQYAGNQPVVAIDLDGLEPFFIHGTFSNESTWSKKFVKEMKSATGWDNAKAGFGNWSGANSVSERRKAANKFYNDLTSQSHNPYAKDKHATLISHSHGGNVAKELNNLLAEDGWTVDIINIETPQREDFQVEYLTEGKYLNFYSSEDLIQYLGTSGKNTTDGKARRDEKADKNIEVKEGFGILKWFRNSAGHSLHNDEEGSKQIIEETKKSFNK